MSEPPGERRAPGTVGRSTPKSAALWADRAAVGTTAPAPPSEQLVNTSIM
ncbi:hypothetical protein [Mycobacterium marinum]|nr:hypothetical protein [Mycobacterium marinum]MDC8980828.1 hypothetical protein [Mycobacterium marinum]MDC8992383.1 hypothetical protein [Mycobacterium marinum]MDC8997746.1 hypothetical protein [Mycobacterium marinum]MDC9008486.1 hypothetical protein [Mycobacterium marinum]MDC9014762.1 hypothetical protein [Mycobacterium marinum]